MSTHDNGFGTVIVLQHALEIATFAVWAPVGLLGVIGQKHVLTLHLQGDHQEGAWIRIRLTGLTEFDVARHSQQRVFEFSSSKQSVGKWSGRKNKPLRCAHIEL